MQYALLIYEDESKNSSHWPAGTRQAFFEEFHALTRELREKGILLASQRLTETSSATTVQVRDGQTLTTDGPFAETKESLAGFYLLECADLDEALRWAARVPIARTGSIEVRPVYGGS